MGKSPAELFPQWVIILALLPLILFPLTLAYVIVVQKAMDVSVAVRQGLQYALARNGVRVLQALLVAAVIIAAVAMAEDASRNRPQKITVIALGIIAALTIRRIGERVRTWVDRRFFREAYNAEQVLTELSEQVRAMVETKSLRRCKFLRSPSCSEAVGPTVPRMRWDTVISRVLRFRPGPERSKFSRVKRNPHASISTTANPGSIAKTR